MLQNTLKINSHSNRGKQFSVEYLRQHLDFISLHCLDTGNTQS